VSGGARTLGFSWPVLVALAALAAPRVVLHDLGVIEEGSVVNGLFVFVPPACWIAAVLWRRPARPFATVVVIGALYGVFLAVGHQLLWDVAFGGVPPTLGGMDPGTAEAVLRTETVGAGLLTGTLVGVVTGGVALVIGRVVPARASEHRTEAGAPRSGRRAP
jgi:hypothetical protein